MPRKPDNHTTLRRAIIVLVLSLLAAIALTFAALFGMRALFTLWR